jgi:adenylate kinase
LLFDFHSSDFFPVRYFDLVVLLRCDNTHLHDRLSQQGYAPNKILDNIDCELLDVTHDEVFGVYD